MSKKIWWILGILLVLAIVLIVLKKKEIIGKKEAVKVATEKVERRTIIETVSASGKVYPEDERKVSSDVSGEVVEMYVEEGDSVRKGQLLAKVFADVLTSDRDRAASVVNQQEAQVGNTEASLRAFEARLNQAKLAYDRQKKLFDDKVISRAEFETAESSYLTAKADLDAARQTIRSGKASVQSAQASLTAANKNLSRTTVVSPMDGIVSLLAVKKGERVAGNSFSLGTEIMRVADMSKIEVRVDVGENDIPKVKIGDSAIVEVDAYNDRKFKGVVTQISSSSTSAQTQAAATSTDVTNYKVYIRIDPASYADLIDPAKGKNLPFRPGMSASADIMTTKQANVIAVPILAVTTRDKNEQVSKTKAKAEEDKKKAQGQETAAAANAVLTDEMEEVVFIMQKDGTVKKVAIKTHIQDNEYIEVLSGVKEGDEVISAPYNTISKTLKDGMKVTVVPKDKVYEEK
ncbi:HlyD family efflux transporter periplasmic adaptor subunit [Lacibacter luteus]|uniref:HlyD family efflux transporter periplasmic adaptor subunit n=1 Tax=Lacibacter luteus TaxID=2508719 RepID=A0A4Q1CHD7_9BACT|nr:efflux RND transporter periplasmic adaptor subunit [Lacibacter luteus]RXK59736.1 HlyD family efflux transporter periplasmic adaptor subunit [Lacibacter luteus]